MIDPDEAREVLEWWGRGVFDHGAAERALQTIANMRYEYAVQVEETPGVWRFLHSSGESTGLAMSAAWSKNTEMASAPLEKYRHRETTRARIVRRLVSHVEVVE